MSLNAKIRRQIKKMPKYEINKEAFENQAIAKTRAYGRSAAVQAQEDNIEQGAANAAYDASNVANDTSSLLSTIAAINANKNNSLRGLAADEAMIQQQNTGELYAANDAIIDEKDKAWNQNVMAPWAAKLQDLQRRKANRTGFWNNLAGGLIGAVASVATGGGLLNGKKQNSGSTATNGQSF